METVEDSRYTEGNMSDEEAVHPLVAQIIQVKLQIAASESQLENLVSEADTFNKEVADFLEERRKKRQMKIERKRQGKGILVENMIVSSDPTPNPNKAPTVVDQPRNVNRNLNSVEVNLPGTSVSIASHEVASNQTSTSQPIMESLSRVKISQPREKEHKYTKIADGQKKSKDSGKRNKHRSINRSKHGQNNEPIPTQNGEVRREYVLENDRMDSTVSCQTKANLDDGTSAGAGYENQDDSGSSGNGMVV